MLILYPHIGTYRPWQGHPPRLLLVTRPCLKFMEGLKMPNPVQYYSHHAKELKHSQKDKIRKFIENDCIEYEGDNVFLCHPIPGYNSTTYRMTSIGHGEFECDCQGYQTRKKAYERGAEQTRPSCSHIGALFEHFARFHKARREERVFAGLQLVLEARA
jgi:hypothetical protein